MAKEILLRTPKNGRFQVKGSLLDESLERLMISTEGVTLSGKRTVTYTFHY